MKNDEGKELIYSTDPREPPSNLIDIFDRATRVHNQPEGAPNSPTPNNNVSHICDMRSPGHRIVCLIDGDGNIFSSQYLANGTRGGHEAAAALTEFIHRYFPFTPRMMYTLHVYVFLNQQGLRKTLRDCGKTHAALHLDDFVRGFNQANRFFNIVDVGKVKEGADRKVTAFLGCEIVLPETAYIVFGGTHDNGYASDLNHFKTSGYGDKLWLLEGYSTLAHDIRSLNLPMVPNLGLFEREKLGSNSEMTTRNNRGRQRSCSEPGSVPTFCVHDSVLAS